MGKGGKGGEQGEFSCSFQAGKIVRGEERGRGVKREGEGGRILSFRRVPNGRQEAKREGGRRGGGRVGITPKRAIFAAYPKKLP